MIQYGSRMSSDTLNRVLLAIEDRLNAVIGAQARSRVGGPDEDEAMEAGFSETTNELRKRNS